jgi:glycosyltransferase involved in cell wall biosynthesis
MILTERDNCLVCGAYESIAVGKPMILSDTYALREYFGGSAVYTRNNRSEIRRSIEEVIARKDSIRDELLQIREERNKEWEYRKSRLEKLVFDP